MFHIGTYDTVKRMSKSLTGNWDIKAMALQKILKDISQFWKLFVSLLQKKIKDQTFEVEVSAKWPVWKSPVLEKLETSNLDSR